MSFNIAKILLIFNVVLLAVPIVFIKIAGIDAPLSDLTLLFSLPIFLFGPISKEKILLSICILLSVISIFAVSVFYADQIELNPIVSFIYFFRPYFAYFLAVYLIRDKVDFDLQFTLFARIFSFVAIVISASIILSGSPVRIDGELMGNFLGLAVFGTYGVNSLAVLYVLMFVVIFVNLISKNEENLYFRVFHILGLCALIFMILGSASREALLGFIVFLSFYTVAYLKKNKVKAMIVVGLIIYSLVALYFRFQDLIDGALLVVINRSLDAFESGDWDEFSSGRFSLVSLALKDIGTSPLFGTGFYGFNLFNKLSLENSSPHNQYITSLWKMGLFAATFYFLFIFSIVKGSKVSYSSTRAYFIALGIRRLSLVVFAVFCLTWDVLMVPNVSMIFMFLIGACVKLNTLNLQDGKG